ncbi:hypothetical protein [Eggerthella lenta]|uniref:hypothetical protein n=1 Tax=Eggerthella lenta TaxID=84112 RepID=UPI003B75C4E9
MTWPRGRKKNGWMYWSLVRGCRAMLESLVLGYKALEIAALHAFAEEGGRRTCGGRGGGRGLQLGQSCSH